MKIIGSLASHLGISDNEFGELLAAGKLSKFWSCYKNLGLRVKTHRYHYITWIAFDEAFAPLQWEHLPRHQIIWENTRPAWVWHPTYGWVEISNGEKIFLDARYWSSEILVNSLVDRSAAEEVLKNGGLCKISRAGLQWGTVQHNIGKLELSLPKNCVPMTKLRPESLGLENQEMNLTICALNAELAEANNMSAENQPLVSTGAQFYKLKSIK